MSDLIEQLPDEPGTGIAASTAQLNSPANHRIPRRQHVELERALAIGELTRAQLARRYGVTRSAITQFAQRHAGRIEEIKQHLDDEFAGLWIYQQRERIAAYQAEYEAIADNPHHEWVKARLTALKSVAEETGQLPGRTQINVMPVVHVVEGVVLEDLK